jgi:hypothetical protein
VGGHVRPGSGGGAVTKPTRNQRSYTINKRPAVMRPEQARAKRKLVWLSGMTIGELDDERARLKAEFLARNDAGSRSV